MRLYQSTYTRGVSTALLMVLLASSLIGCGDEPEVIAPAKPEAKVSAKPNVMPPLNLDILPKNNSPSATDYIIDGSASMCGYFNAELNATENALPITKLVQSIQSVLRTNDRLLIFMQDESSDKAIYIPFETFENQLMQGKCDLNGQYTELGLILQDYREQPELQERSVAIVSDMHFLPAERTGFENQYDAFLSDYVNAGNASSTLSNGILSLRSPFVGTYYTVNNATKMLEQTQKHLHFFWLTKQTSSAQQIEKIQRSILSTHPI